MGTYALTHDVYHPGQLDPKNGECVKLASKGDRLTPSLAETMARAGLDMELNAAYHALATARDA